jgi:transcriptional regulator with XRE-family HTH domain
MDMRVLVGANVRRRRVELGMTQEDLAEAAGLSQQYISGLERGQRNPTVVTLWELSRPLSLLPADLLKP